MKFDEPIKPDWNWGTPEGGRVFDRLLDRRLSFREILEWQEEAESLSLRLRSQQRNAVEKPGILNDAPPGKTDAEG